MVVSGGQVFAEGECPVTGGGHVGVRAEFAVRKQQGTHTHALRRSTSQLLRAVSPLPGPDIPSCSLPPPLHGGPK